MAVWTIVVAAGSGSRFGSAKQFALVNERRVVDHAVEVARRCSDGVVVVLPADMNLVAVDADISVIGDDTRCGSVRAGLAALPPEATVVLVHDAARPCASDALYQRVKDAIAGGADAVIPVVPVGDTLKQVLWHSDDEGVVAATVDRDSLAAVQTPQAFRREVLERAHASGGEASDDAGLVEAVGCKVSVVAGEASNLKITSPDDLKIARTLLGRDDAHRVGIRRTSVRRGPSAPPGRDRDS